MDLSGARPIADVVEEHLVRLIRARSGLLETVTHALVRLQNTYPSQVQILSFSKTISADLGMTAGTNSIFGNRCGSMPQTTTVM